MDSATSFGYWVRRRRKALDLTRGDLARSVGCAEVTIQKIEADERRPSKQVAERLADHLAIAPQERSTFLSCARGERAIDHLAEPGSTEALHGLTPTSIIATGHTAEASQLQAPSAPETNLPLQPTSLIGRKQQVEVIVSLLREPSVHLVTFTGPGGVGKTRLGLQAATELLDTFTHGCWLVNLAPIRDPSLVVMAIAQTLDLSELPGQPIVRRLMRYLRDKQILLILDNFEQVADAAPLIADLLAECRGLKVLATSRAVLKLRGEKEVAVPPLALPERTLEENSSNLSDYAAVQLFIQRALDTRPTLQLNTQTIAAIAEICRRVDGLPLAIELAAARIKLFPPPQLLVRLEQRLPLLTGGPRDLPVRQQTLRDTIAWSYDLLARDEQVVFRALGVFAGGCTLEAMEAVVAALGQHHGTLVDTISTLIDHSLLQQTGDLDESPRFFMLETIREYASEQLRANDEAETIPQAHAAYYLAFAELVEQHLRGSERRTWLVRLETEHDNLRTALKWALSGGDTDLGLRLAGAMGEFWLIRGYLREGRDWLASALAGGRAHGTVLRAKALNHGAALAHSEADFQTARNLYEESLAISRALGDDRNVALALAGLAVLAVVQHGDYETADKLVDQSLGLFEHLGDTWGRRDALHLAGMSFWHQGGYAQAVELTEEVLKLSRELGDQSGSATALINLACLARSQGNYVRARDYADEALVLFGDADDRKGIAGALFILGHVTRSAHNDMQAAIFYNESLALARQLADHALVTQVLHNQAYLALHDGDHTRAEALLYESLTPAREIGYKDQMAWDLAGLGGVAVAKRQGERAARLLGAADKWFHTVGHAIDPTERDEHDRYIMAAREQLGETVFARAWAEGQAMMLEQAVAYALDEDTSPDA